MSASLPGVPSLRELLADIPEPRDPGGRRYPLVGLLICAATSSGCKNPNQIWGWKVGPHYLKALGFRRGKSISKSPLYDDLLNRLDSEAMAERVQRWSEAVVAELRAMGLKVVKGEEGLKGTRPPPAIALDG